MKRPLDPCSKAQAMMEYSLVMIVIVTIVFLAFKKNGGGVLEQTYNKTTQYFDTGTTAITGGYYSSTNSSFVRVEPTAVDGGWCAWGPCMGGSQSRECACPRPAFGGSGCANTGSDGAVRYGSCGGRPQCETPPAGIYMAAHYWAGSDCGSYPSCPNPATSWVSTAQMGGQCGFRKWRHTQCGKLYKAVTSICDGDPCVLGLVPQGGQASFHMGAYNVVTNKCDPTSTAMKSVSGSGYAFAGSTNYTPSQSVASWGQ